MKDLIIVTGGAGFVGSNLIELFLTKTKFKIISIDNYTSGSKRNELKSSRIKYLKGDTKNISKILKRKKKRIKTIFHFGEFARIYYSFIKLGRCLESNTIGTNEVFKFCLENKIKLVYSATSASLGNQGFDKNLSPYAFTKAKNLELLENFKKWFNFKYEVIYFYNVYGPRQIKRGSMATVIGIFEEKYKNNLPLTIVRPGTQTRRFTHIKDTVEVCYKAWKKNLSRHYTVTNRKSLSIIQVAKMFNTKIKFLPPREGERYASALTKMHLSNKVHKTYGKIQLKNYISNFIKNS